MAVVGGSPLLLTLLFSSSLLLASALGTSSSFAAASSLLGLTEEEKARPVTKVVNLLKDMLAQLEKEAKDDEEIYDTMSCWCKTNGKEKAQSTSDAEARIADLTTKIEELTASSAKLGTEIKKHEGEVVSNQRALDEATALRQKQLAEFDGEEKDLLGSISALKAAIATLSKHQEGSSMLQLRSSRVSVVASALRRAMVKHAGLFEGSLAPFQRQVAMSLMEGSADLSEGSQGPDSGEVYGILTQMLETFQANLKTSQTDEAANQKAFEDLKAAKEQEISSGKEQVDAKTQQLADTDEKNAQSKEDLSDTKSSLAKDQDFLAMLQEKCSMTDTEWEERRKTRQQEMEAVSKALAILSSDDARDQFSKTFSPSLLQTFASSSESRASSRETVSQMLTKAAHRLGSQRLSALAISVKKDAFQKVETSIKDMITQLNKEKAEEGQQKDWCGNRLNKNQLKAKKMTRAKTAVDAQIEDLEMSAKQFTGSVDALKKQIAEMQVQVKRAGDDREQENKEFQSMIADQRATQKMLTAALSVLEGVYGRAELVQAPAGPPPPGGFDTYNKNGSGGGVVSMIQEIINDAKTMEKESMQSEMDAQRAYEEFVKNTNYSIQAKSKEIVNKSEEKAKTEAELIEAQDSKTSTMKEMKLLSERNARLHQSCDFLLKNFGVHQKALDEEADALNSALAIL